MGKRSRKNATGKGVLERIRVAKRAGRITGQVMRGNYTGFTEMVHGMTDEELGKELEKLVQAPTNFQNRDLIERMIQILSDEATGRGKS